MPVERGVERLRAKAAAWHGSELFKADVALFVEPKCAAFVKDSKDKDKHLRQALDDWLRAPVKDAHVLLLHGRGGSGKSLCVPGLCPTAGAAPPP